MIKAKLRSKLEGLELAHEAAERDLGLLDDRSTGFSALASDVAGLLEAYERISA